MTEVPAHTCLLSQAQIEACIDQIAQQIQNDYATQNPLLFGLLNGCRPLLSALQKKLPIPHDVAMIKISFYRDQNTPNATPHIEGDLHDLTRLLHGRHAILVDDLIDTGKTLAWTRDWILKNTAIQSLKTCVLLNRQTSTQKPIIGDYVGYHFESEEWVIGFGMDPFRELPYLGLIPPQN